MAQENVGSALKKKRNCAPNLPDEIIDEILLLLPARSVLRCRVVCRSWATRLSSQAFTDAYAAKAVTRRMHKLVVFAPSPTSQGRRSTAVYSCSSQGAADPLFTVTGLRADFLSVSSRPWRGLVLFSDTRTLGRYWACNPSTGECRALHPPRRRDLSLSSAGLAFDGLTMECKVVHLFFEDGVGLRCEVCALGEPGFKWRPVTAGLDSCGNGLYENIITSLQTEEAVTKVPPVFADGGLHWLRYPRRTGCRDAILRFSAADESFGLVSAPDSVPLEDYVRLGEHLPMVPVHLAELKGSLCLVHDLRRRGQGASSLDVWVLRDRSVGDWSLDYRIPVTPLLARDVHVPRFITVLCCCSGDDQQEERLLVATSEHKVFACAMSTGRVETVLSVRETSIGLQKEAPAAVWIALYEDSLVRIGDEESHREKEVLSAVTEVLLRLPLKSIVQSKLVCRKWCTLIEGESFVAAHMSMKRPKRIVIATNGSARRAFFEFTPLERWLHASPSHLASSLVKGKVICSKPCYGLNLISSSTDDYLCNPCTGAIQCLGIRGRSHFTPCHGQPSCHTFSVGRNIGFGFDHSTGEHVAVEIGHIYGTLACLLKTSESDAWICAGIPPLSATDMPPAHVDGTLYWMGQQTMMETQQRVVIMAFNISARAFDILLCDQPCLNIDHGAFLVELNNTLSLIITNREAEEMEIWTMDIKRRAWVKVYKVHLQGQPYFSPKSTVVVPMEISGDDRRILLSTGRALGYYDVKAAAIETIFSLDHMHIPPCNMVFPMLCDESLVPVHDEDELPVSHVAPPTSGGRMDGQCGHSEHTVAENSNIRTPRSIISMCQNHGCQGNGDIYSRCCNRLICSKCVRRCAGHYQGLHIPLDNTFDEVIEEILRNGLALEHPCVPDPDYYCYYYSSATDNDNVARHVFISLKDFVQGKQPRHLTECAYRMDGHGNVREAWACQYLDFDSGQGDWYGSVRTW